MVVVSCPFQRDWVGLFFPFLVTNADRSNSALIGKVCLIPKVMEPSFARSPNTVNPKLETISPEPSTVRCKCLRPLVI